MIEDQQKLLQEAKKRAKEHAYFMKKSLQNVNLRNGLKFASMMLAELGTSILTPRNYYILWMSIFDDMRQLQTYFREDIPRGRKMVDVYEAVQHAPTIISRLYLMITVGSVYIQSHETGNQKILEDLMEMMKAIQNPLRGLFLRYYFLKLCKDRLPDTGSGYESPGRGIQQAIDIIHINLRESTNLWMRIGIGRDKVKRLKQKNDMKMLIGENLMRISSLDGVNISIYKQMVLPRMLELIRNSKDGMSQQYLLDCMIQGFPEQFHIHTLPELLQTCSKECQRQVDMKIIFVALMQRLSSYLTNSGNVIDNIQNGQNIYGLFKVNIQELINKADSQEVHSTLSLYSAFLQFTIKCYPTRHDYVNQIISEAAKYCQKSEANIDDQCQTYISKFLIHPLQSLTSMIFTMQEYPKLMKYLKFRKRRDVAKQIAKAVGKGTINLIDQNIVNSLLIFLAPLLAVQPDYEKVPDLVFKDEQTQMAKIVFQVTSEDPGQVWNILKLFIAKYVEGGEQRMIFTLPSAIFRLFLLAVQMRDANTEVKVYKKIFELCRTLIQKLGPIDAVLSIKLYLQLVLLINEIDQPKMFDEFTYQTASQGLLLYEAHVNDPNMKQMILELVINTCLRLHCLSQQNYDTLISNVTSYCSKILKKNQQCKILLNCCYLFSNPLANPQRIHQILKKCAKLANTQISKSITNLPLLFDILQSYIYWVRRKTLIQDSNDAIPQIIQLIEEKLNQEDDTEEGKKTLQQCKLKWNVLSPIAKT